MNSAEEFWVRRRIRAHGRARPRPGQQGRMAPDAVNGLSPTISNRFPPSGRNGNFSPQSLTRREPGVARIRLISAEIGRPPTCQLTANRGDLAVSASSSSPTRRTRRQPPHAALGSGGSSTLPTLQARRFQDGCHRRNPALLFPCSGS